MSQSVPYHPALTLGNVIKPSLMKQFKLVNQSLKKINLSKDKLDSLILNLRSANLTEKQIKSLDITFSTERITSYKKQLSEMITTAAENYFQVRIDEEEKIRTIYGNDDTQEDLFFDSPLDYDGVKDKGEKGYLHLPWSSDSLKLDYQYFSYNEKDHSETLNSIKSFIKNSTNTGLNSEEAEKVNKNAIDSLENQEETLNIQGTLVISATCTHKNVRLIHPFKINVSQITYIWNKIYKDNTINIKKPYALKENNDGLREEDFLHIVSGAIYGSQFIGMVHLVKNNESKIFHQDLSNERVYKDIKNKIESENLIAHAMGDITIDPQRKNAITTSIFGEETSIYLNIFSTGVIPKMSSQDTKNSVDVVLKSKDSIVTNMYKIDDSSNSAETYKALTQKLSIKKAFSSHILKTLAEIDREEDKTLNINSLLTAFSNYVEAITKTTDDAFGVPVGYYIKSYSKQDVIDLWRDHQKDLKKKEETEEEKKKDKK